MFMHMGDGVSNNRFCAIERLNPTRITRAVPEKFNYRRVKDPEAERMQKGGSLHMVAR